MNPSAWGRLLRLSLAPSAAADVLAGLVIGGHGRLAPLEPTLLLVGSSLAVYHGGLALNDWADRRGDARTRPDRPIPSGRISPTAALWAAAGLLVLGIALASLASPAAGLWMAAIATLAAVYDLWGRGPWLGPSLLCVCRAGNLGLGVFFPSLLAVAAREPPPAYGWLACALYGLYVLCASRVGRLEDEEDSRPLGRRPARWLLAAAAVLASVPLLDPHGPGGPAGFDPLAAAVAWSGAATLAWPALRTRAWTRALVERSMGLALRRLLVFTAALALVGAAAHQGGAWVAAGILCGYPLSFALRRLFPPS